MSFRPLWVWRALLLAFAIVYLASADLQAWLPPLVPFVAAAAVEAQFFFAGVRAGRQRRAFADPGPQQRDLDELGWQAHTVTVRQGEAELVLRPGELDDEEIAEWLDAAPRRAGRARARAATSWRAIDDGGEPRRAARSAARAGAGTPDANAPPAGARRAGALRRAVLPRHAGRALAAPLGVGARGDRRRARPAGVPDRRAPGRRDLRRLGPARRLRPGRRRAGRGRRPPCLADAADLLPALPDPPHTGAPTARRSGHAIAVLAHEAWHLHGQSSEALANCFAYQSGVAVGEALGLSPSTARQLMREQLADNPSDFADSPQYVVPSGCSTRRQPRPAPRRHSLPLSERRLSPRPERGVDDRRRDDEPAEQEELEQQRRGQPERRRRCPACCPRTAR